MYLLMKRISILIILAITLHSCNLLSAAGITSGGQPTKQAPDKLTSSTANSVENVDHSTWDALLKKHVDANGMVDYKGFKKLFANAVDGLAACLKRSELVGNKQNPILGET